MALRVIGAGLGRTGTASLKVALEQLGVGPCYHMGEVLDSMDRAAAWLRASEEAQDWDQIFAGYGATVDYPACSFWRQLAETYPSAKILLSVRDSEEWFESTQATIFSQQTLEFFRQSPLKEFFETAVWRGFEDRIRDKQFMVSYYEHHVEEVRSSVEPDCLLVYDVRQGWEPLCEFLDIAVPDTTFPHINAREDFKRMTEFMREALSDHFSEARTSAFSRELFSRDPG